MFVIVENKVAYTPNWKALINQITANRPNYEVTNCLDTVQNNRILKLYRTVRNKPELRGKNRLSKVPRLSKFTTLRLHCIFVFPEGHPTSFFLSKVLI